MMRSCHLNHPYLVLTGLIRRKRNRPCVLRVVISRSLVRARKPSATAVPNFWRLVRVRGGPRLYRGGIQQLAPSCNRRLGSTVKPPSDPRKHRLMDDISHLGFGSLLPLMRHSGEIERFAN
jgi:hypothetical protein